MSSQCLACRSKASDGSNMPEKICMAACIESVNGGSSPTGLPSSKIYEG